MADGNTLIVKTEDLLYILKMSCLLSKKVEYISVYDTAKGFLYWAKHQKDCVSFRSGRLRYGIYGMESGDDDVLREQKGVDTEEMDSTGKK